MQLQNILNVSPHGSHLSTLTPSYELSLDMYKLCDEVIEYRGTVSQTKQIVVVNMLNYTASAARSALPGSMNIIRITIMHNHLCANITSFRCDVSAHDLHAFNKLQLLYKDPLVAIGPRLNSATVYLNSLVLQDT